MKLFQYIIPILGIIATSCANAAGQPAIKAKAAAKQPITATTHAYETAEQIKAMPRCKATADGRSPCSVRLSTADGKRIYIGSPGATKEVVAFLPTLKDGHTYTLPDAFLDYQKTHQ